MARADYDVIEEYTGTGSKLDYTFSFKIEDLSQLLVVELDTTGAQTQKVRGTDAVYIDSVTFDSVDGGGTVFLNANLTLNYKLKLILANDAPTQPSQFKNKGSFTLQNFENALDFIVGAVQRLAYRSARSVQLDESIMTAEFDPTIPVDMIGASGYTMVTNEDGDGWEIGPSVGTIQDAIDAGVAAEAAQAAAEAAALEATFSWTEHEVTDGQAATALTDETVDFATYSSKYYFVEIIRGSPVTVHSNGTLAIQKLAGTGRVVVGGMMAEEAHGVTFSLSQTGTVATLRAALDSGAGNGTIKLTATRVPV